MDDEAAKEKKVSKGPPSDKGYYLFTKNHVQWVPRHNYAKIKTYLSRRVSEYSGPLIADLVAQTGKVPVPSQYLNKMTIEQFWLKQIANLAERYPLFCQENTYQTSKVMSGVEKFPIQYWNNPGEKLGSPTAASSDSKANTGLELKDLGVAGFFFKSGYKLLEASKMVPQSASKVNLSSGSKRNAADHYSAGERKASGSLQNS